MEVLGMVVVGLIISIWVLAVYCALFNAKLGHRVFGWHYVNGNIGFNGCSLTGTCSGCGKKVLQDSQGNWF